jgi:hypothetical protein
MGASGKKVKGRYSFIYVYEDDEWKISHHHSSIMPEGIVTAEPITETEVRSLFGLWNDALATKDPKKVAARYGTPNREFCCQLYPTSDVPRTDHWIGEKKRNERKIHGGIRSLLEFCKG